MQVLFLNFRHIFVSSWSTHSQKEWLDRQPEQKYALQANNIYFIINYINRDSRENVPWIIQLLLWVSNSKFHVSLFGCRTGRHPDRSKWNFYGRAGYLFQKRTATLLKFLLFYILPQTGSDFRTGQSQKRKSGCMIKNVRFPMGVYGIFCSGQRPGYI